MGIAGIAMLIGVVVVLIPPALPSAQILIIIGVPLAVLASLWRRTRVLLFIFLGVGWCWWCAQNQLALRLTPDLEGYDLQVSGWVASIPQRYPQYSSFDFAVQQLGGHRPGHGIPKLIRLTWSKTARIPAPGEHWVFHVRLKRPHGYMNPGSFDYEGWLFRHGIGATGYVIHDRAEQLNDAKRYPLLRARYRLFNDIQQALPDDPFAGIVAALAVGERSAIDSEQWRTFQNTGTAHLLSISGLHIGLVAGLMLLLVRFFWRRCAWLCVRLPTPIAGVLAAVFAAVIYAAMAGFSVPTLRALIMLAALTTTILLRRHSRPWNMLGLAMIGVLILNPLSAGEVGFWLSFGAVAAIFYVLNGRVHAGHGKVMQLVRIQWAVGIGLLPLLIFYFHRATLVAPLANIVLVPVYSLAVVPLVLLGVSLLGVWHWAGVLMLKAATGVMALSWPLLERLAAMPLARVATPAPTEIFLVLGSFGVLWLLLPNKIPSRWLGAILLMPLFLYRPSGIPAGGFNLALLDVGQGLSAVVRTTRHTLIYDTGPGFSESSDSGARVVIPWLQNQGIRAPDLTIVSHADNDHAGGLPSLRVAYPKMPVLSGEPERIKLSQACLRGQSWEWDEVRFEILAPDAGQEVTGNDASCVLHVTGLNGSVLLVGDLMRRGEQQLLKLEGDALASEVLVVPHHGSLSSSSTRFIAAVAPKIALFPVGYRNRWGFPKPRVVAAYQKAGAQLLDTATAGAVEIRLWPGHAPEVVSRWRIDGARVWTTH